jgi:hypothetical protein
METRQRSGSSKRSVPSVSIEAVSVGLAAEDSVLKGDSNASGE